MTRARFSRREMLIGGGASVALGTMGALTSRAQEGVVPRTPDRLLFVIAAAGGGSILDSFLPVADTEVSTPEKAGALAVQAASLVAQPEGSNLRCVKNRGGTVAELPAGYPISQVTFLQKHAADTAVLCVEGTSVNHRVAQKRSVTGAGVNGGRTLMEAMALRHGSGLLLPNCNMAQDGYLEPGDDDSVPDAARAEPIADARFFPLQTHGSRGIQGAPEAGLLARARRVRDSLEERSPFARTFVNAPQRLRYLERRELMGRMEELDLITQLMMVTDDDSAFPLGRYGLASSPAAARVLERFPQLTTDPFEAQGALAFMLARAGVTSSVTLSPSFRPELRAATLVNTPLAFDFSHADHYATQNVMWSRMLAVTDGLIDLLKEEDVDGDPAKGKLWDRSVIYLATDFGRDKKRPQGSSQWGSGHHLNNGVVVISPLVKGNRVYGGVDPETCLTYGFDPVTGDPRPDEIMREGDVYAALAHALDIPFDGRRDFPSFVRAG